MNIEPSPTTTDVPEYYADSLNMAFGPYGFGLEFGLIPFPDFNAGPAVLASQTPAKAVVRVRISPQLAQAIKALLVNNMSVYESVFGEIKLAEDLERPQSEIEMKGAKA